MKSKILVILIAFMASTANAADWYSGVTEKFFFMESSNGTVFLTRDGGTIAVSGNSGSCVANQVIFLPGDNEDKELWKSMILAALLSGKDLKVYAECLNSALRVSRFLIDYN